MYDTPDILNLHFLTGIPISIYGCHASITGDGRSICAVTHLAYARTQNSGTGILGFFDSKRIILYGPLFVMENKMGDQG